MSRIACIAVPQLPLQALWRADPELRGVPLAVTAPVVSGGKAAAGAVPLTARLVAVSPEAAVLGARPGQTAAQARAVVPSLQIRPAHPQQIAAARAALHDAALGFAPRVEVPPSEDDEPLLSTGRDLVWLEVGDLGRLHPTEREVALAIRARVAALGLEAGVGIAASKGVARLAAWHACRDDGAGGTHVVPAGGEAAFVGPLPVEELVMASAPGSSSSGGAPASASARASDGTRAAGALLEALRRWGVRSAGRYAELPPREVALRLGALGARLQRLAAGRCDAPLAARAPADEFEEGMELDFAIAEVEPLAFVLRGLIDRLLARLGARHLACAGLGLRLRLESGGHDVRDVPIAAPTREPQTLLLLVRLDVERRPPSAPVVGVVLHARAACAPRNQLDLFQPTGPAPDRLAATLARLQALVGEGAVGSPATVDTHREEAITTVPYSPTRPLGKEKTSPTPEPSAAARRPQVSIDHEPPDPGAAARRSRASLEPACLSFRRFRPERPVEVLLDGADAPRALSGDGLSCSLLIAAGPYRVSGEWWAQGGFARDYWDVHASDGALYRLYRDTRSQWFLAGYYD